MASSLSLSVEAIVHKDDIDVSGVTNPVILRIDGADVNRADNRRPRPVVCAGESLLWQPASLRPR